MPTMSVDDPRRLRRALELAGLGESPISEADKQRLRAVYADQDPATVARALAFLKASGPVAVRVRGRLIRFAVLDGREDTIACEWDRRDKLPHACDDGPSMIQLTRPVAPPVSLVNSQALLAEGRRNEEIARLRERLDVIERSCR